MSDNDQNSKRNRNDNIYNLDEAKKITGMPTTEDDIKHREKALASGKRRHQGVIKMRDTGDNNFMKVVRDQHERRKILDAESKRGLPENLIYDPKKPIDSMELFKNEKLLSKPVRKRSSSGDDNEIIYY